MTIPQKLMHESLPNFTERSICLRSSASQNLLLPSAKLMSRRTEKQYHNRWWRLNVLLLPVGSCYPKNIAVAQPFLQGCGPLDAPFKLNHWSDAIKRGQNNMIDSWAWRTSPAQAGSHFLYSRKKSSIVIYVNGWNLHLQLMFWCLYH